MIKLLNLTHTTYRSAKEDAGTRHNVAFPEIVCRRKIEMSPGVQSRDDTPLGADTIQRDTGSQPDTALGLSYDGRRLVKRKRALLGSNPPRNSRLETHSDGPGAATRRSPCQHYRKHRGRSPDPSKTHLSHGAIVAGSAGCQFRYVTEYKGGSGGDQAGAAAAAWRGARPFDGRPGASRLFGGRRRAPCPRCCRAG
jgi:hypothetical protein